MTDVTAQPGRLHGRRIVITGAASGIGRRTALLFAAEGAALTLLDRDEAGLAEAAREARALGLMADVTDEAAMAHVVEQGAVAMGGIDGVVNAAGIQIRAAANETTFADWRRVIEINLTGTYITVHCCLPWLRQAASASIVTLGSGQGLRPSANRSAYAASKAGVIGLTRALAVELAPAIRVNSVCPGLVDTPMSANMVRDVSAYPLGRIAEAEEIARGILYLTSAESSYVTGATLAVDGGRTLH